MATINNASMPILVTDTALTRPVQPHFCAYLSADAPNLTGGGANATIPFNSLYFSAGGFNTGTYTYTCPTTGIYMFGVTLTWYNVPAPTTCTCGFFTTAYFYDGAYFNGANLKTAGNMVTQTFTLTTSMTAGNTIYVRAAGVGSTNTMGAKSGDASTFWGYLIA